MLFHSFYGCCQPLQTSEGMYLVDCVGNVAELIPYTGNVPEKKAGCLTVLSGAGMPVIKRVKEAAKWYPEYILSVES